MSRLTWDQTGERYFEAGIKQVALYVAAGKGDTKLPGSDYLAGVNWNGVTKVGESPDGADANDLWADDIKYASFRSAEEFNGSIEAYQYPDAFAECNGERKIAKMLIAQQARRAFGLAYKTTVGNDVEGFELGYKLHLVYNATCSPSSRDHETINDSPDAETMSWDFETTPTEVGTIDGVTYKPTSHIVIDSRDFVTEGELATLAAIENALYGTSTTNPYLPTPATVYGLLTAGVGVEYSVTLNPAGGTITDGHDVTSYTYSDSLATELPGNAYVTRTGGYTFEGWVDANGSGDLISEIPAETRGDKTYIAVWSKDNT